MSAHRSVYDFYSISNLGPSKGYGRLHTSLSNCFASMVTCLMTIRGHSSESFTMNVETDLGPRVSFVLNSLLLSSRRISSASWL